MTASEGSGALPEPLSATEAETVDRETLRSWLAGEPEMVSRSVAESIACDYAHIRTVRLREITDKDAATIERLTTHAGMADDVQLQLAHQAETLQAKDAATTDAVERWARAFDEKAETLAAWQQERLSGITSTTPKYEAMNASHEAFQWASYELRAAVRLPEPEPAEPPDYQDIEDAIRDALSHLCLRDDDIGRAARDVHRSLTVAAPSRLPEKGEPT